MPQPSSFLRFQSSKSLKSCAFLFMERRGSTLSKVKHLQFLMLGVLFLVRFTKNNTPPAPRTENV